MPKLLDAEPKQPHFMIANGSHATFMSNYRSGIAMKKR